MRSFARTGSTHQKPPLLKGGGPPKAVEGFLPRQQESPSHGFAMPAPFDKGASGSSRCMRDHNAFTSASL